jgi:hypothetical protein
MSLSVGSIFQAMVLLLNAMAILSERRFLNKYGLSSADPSCPASPREQSFGMPMDTFGGGFATNVFRSGTPGTEFGVEAASRGVRPQIAAFLSSIRMIMRVPLIFINCGLVVFAMVFG